MTRNVLIALGVCLLIGPGAGAQLSVEQANDEAMVLAKKITDAGAATYNTKNARAMADYYTDDAQVFVTGKDNGAMKTKVYSGKPEIEKLYEDLFKNAEQINAKNHVELARRVDPELLLIYGTFEPNEGGGKYPFFQVRQKQGDRWLTNNLQVFIVSPGA